MDLMKDTAVTLSEKIRAGEITVMDAAMAAMDAIREKESAYHCYVTVLDREAVLKRAQEVQKLIEEGKLNGPLAGVPAAIKDNMCTRGVRTTCSSRILEDFVPPYTAEAVENLEKAGVVIIERPIWMNLPWEALRRPHISAQRKIHGTRLMCREVLPAVPQRRWQRRNVFLRWVLTPAVPSGSRRPTAVS